MAAATAEAGKRSPGNDLKGDGGPRDRREAWEEWHRERWYPQPFFGQPFYPRRYRRERYVDLFTRYNRCMWKYDNPYYCERYAPMVPDYRW